MAGLQHTGETYLELDNFPTKGQSYFQNQFFFYYETAGECLDLANYTINRVGSLTFVEKDSRKNASTTSWSTRFELSYYTFMAHSTASIQKVVDLCPTLPTLQVNIPVRINDSTCLGKIFDGAANCSQFEWNTLEFVDDFNMNLGQWGGMTCSNNGTLPSYPRLRQSTFWVNIFSNTPFPTPTPVPTTIVLPPPAAVIPTAVGTYTYIQCSFGSQIPNVGNLMFNTEFRVVSWTLPVIQTTYWYINQCSGTAVWTVTASYQPFFLGFVNSSYPVFKFIPLKKTITANGVNTAQLIRSVCVKLPVLQDRPFDVSNIDCYVLALYSKATCPVTHNIISYAPNSVNDLLFSAVFPICSERDIDSPIYLPSGAFIFTRSTFLGFKK